MALRRNALGRGLDALIPSAPPSVDTATGSPTPTSDGTEGAAVSELPIDRIDPNPDQPRRRFDPGALESLCASVKRHGVLQPVVVRRAGERFAVRNSLAEAVVEGTGDHCCEYMTGGAVVVLGKVGRNVGAGMTGGLGYFLDEDETFPTKVNGEIVSMQRVTSQAGEAQLKALIEAHVAKTGSPKGAFVLVNWKEYLPKFWQLVPPSEANTPEASDEVVSAETVNAA